MGTLTSTGARARIVMNPTAAYVKNIFQILQGIQIAFPKLSHSIGSSVLEWSDKNEPSIAQKINPQLAPDVHKLKCVEKYLLQHLFIRWDNESKTNYTLCVTCPNILEVLMELSYGRCFSQEPLSMDNAGDVPWIKARSYFTFGQLVAAGIELALWRAYGDRNLLPTEAANQGVAGCILNYLGSVSCSSAQVLSILYLESALTAKELAQSKNDDLINMFMSIMKQRIKFPKNSDEWLSVGSVSGKGTALQRFWALSLILQRWRCVELSERFRNTTAYGAGESVAERGRSGARPLSQQHIIFLLDALLGTPLSDSFSLVQEHKTRTRDRIWHQATVFAADQLLKSLSYVGMPAASTAAPHGHHSKKKKKKSEKHLKSSTASNSPLIPRKAHDEERVKQRNIDLNIGLSPGFISDTILTHTAVRSLLSDISPESETCSCSDFCLYFTDDR